MKSEETLLISCLRAFLNNSACTADSENINWPRFCRLAQMHYVGGMVYLALKNRPDIPEDALARLKHLFEFTVSCSVRRVIQTKEVEAALCSAEIPHIYFKGQELCRYYPVPEVRLMSDVDILIRAQDRRQMERTLEDAGFTLKHKNITEHVYEKNQIKLEVHTEFAQGPETGADFTSWCGGGFENGQFSANSYTGYFRPSFHFLYLIYHTAKHMYSTGAGIRMFLDLAVFWNHYQEEICPADLAGDLKNMKLDTFADTAFWICNHWFGTEIPMEKEPDTDLRTFMENYIFSGGIYGLHKRNFSDLYIRRAVTEENIGKKYRQKLRVYLRFFFPARKRMELFLPAVRNYPFLLPAAWVLRWYQGFFRKRKQSLQSLKRIEAGNSNAEKEYQMLKRLGLAK